jgi:hypothetical protein
MPTESVDSRSDAISTAAAPMDRIGGSAPPGAVGPIYSRKSNQLATGAAWK